MLVSCLSVVVVACFYNNVDIEGFSSRCGSCGICLCSVNLRFVSHIVSVISSCVRLS